jgi:hypothetical protein
MRIVQVQEPPMTDPNKRMEQRDLERRREQELKDLETERTIGPRPLEGLSGDAGTTWTEMQDEASSRLVHGTDEEESRELSESQIPEWPRE